MKLDTRHYVPILKWRRGEQGALADLYKEQKEAIKPLLEFVMPKPDKELRKKEPHEIRDELVGIFRTKKLPEIPKDLFGAIGKNHAFVDFSLLYTHDLRMISLKQVFENGARIGLNLTPVVNLSDSVEYKDLVFEHGKKNSNGICVRLTEHDLSNLNQSNDYLLELVERSGINTEQIDLLFDLKDTSEELSYKAAISQTQDVVNLSHWRSIVLASGSYPKDLSECKIDEDNLLPRTEWKAWKDVLENGNFQRMPTFSDYTIRHPIHNEAFQFYEPTASIKYTLEDSWWIMKGKKRKFEFFLANALLLTRTASRFRGEDFCAGDKYVAEKAAYYPEYLKNPDKGGTGGTEQWIRMGINHHLAVVVDQLSS